MRFWNRNESLESQVNWTILSRQRKKGDLLAVLKTEANKFTPDDLNIMMIRYDEKIKDLPPEYRQELEKFARVQITDGYNTLMTTSLDKIHANEKLLHSWKDFVNATKKNCQKGNNGDKYRSLKYLIAAFNIFILGIPPHPIGMPFPGGLRVELYEGVYYCPVKDKWKRDLETFCSFCPAEQSRIRDMELTKEERNMLEKEEKLNNYFYNFKG